MLIPILMGSVADLEHARKIVKALDAFGLASEMRVASAHKTLEHLIAVLDEYESRDEPRVYITIAGRSNALSGAVDARVSAPVIACPPYSDSFGGADIFSSIRTPSGVAPALVLDPDNAALLAAKILALGDKALAERVRQAQEAGRNKVIDADAWLRTLS
ncbi:MAG: AIR carboxylase family protein [Caldilineales bacterium]|nr:AIR carboxylase family protein [Caldilineales bacterium]MCW5858088.1 AIR carboxylase family protein [Caldilineales bacterium]